MTETETPTSGVRTIAPGAVAVALQGTRGRDREVILDAAVWEDVSTRFGTSWVLGRTGDAPAPLQVLQGDGTGKVREPPLALAPYVAGVERGSGQVVWHVDGDALHLRRFNLHRLDLSQWLRRGAPMPKVRRQKVTAETGHPGTPDALSMTPRER